uniref:Uncharacterized protein n=1 Tax=Timema monikensis TaxID=170555 RepID=A0A7R9DYZ9_9NEOP|nr:unnamed protein product [Timema monikensis]
MPDVTYIGVLQPKPHNPHSIPTQPLRKVPVGVCFIVVAQVALCPLVRRVACVESGPRSMGWITLKARYKWDDLNILVAERRPPRMGAWCLVVVTNTCGHRSLCYIPKIVLEQKVSLLEKFQHAKAVQTKISVPPELQKDLTLLWSKSGGQAQKARRAPADMELGTPALGYP